MKMNENTNGQFINILKRTNKLQIYTYAIKENYKPYILGINQRLPNSTQNTRRRNLTAISRPPRGFHRNPFSRFQTDLLARTNRSKKASFIH